MRKGLFIEPLMTAAQARAWVTEEEFAQAQKFTHTHRQEEFLTWRAIVARLCPGARIDYNAVGAPVILNHPELFIAVSHCSGYVAVVISNTPATVDIELLSRHFDRVAKRYISEEEEALFAAIPHYRALLWCAKESLYKLAGVAGLDLRRDLHVVSIDSARGELCGVIGSDHPVRLSYRTTALYAVVYLL